MKAEQVGLIPWRRWAAAMWPVLLIVLLTVPALQPLWQAGLQQTDDGAHHVFRLFSLDRALRAGHIGARWQAEEGFGYGFPVLNFYAPFSYYFGLFFHRLGAGFATSFEWTLAAGLVLSAVAMYLFARELLGRWGGALAAVAYAWAPYHLADAWMRGALAEHLAFIWLPLVLLALLQVSRAADRSEPRAMWWPVLWGGAAVAGLVLTHNLTVLLAAPALAAWVALLMFAGVSGKAARWRFLRRVVVMGLLGLALSAAFWLPALAEASLVRAGHIPEEFATWSKALERPFTLFSTSWEHWYFSPERGIGHRLGLAQGGLAVLGLVIGLIQWRKLSRVAAAALPTLAGLTLFALFMQSELSEAVWRIPGLLLLQFPWRWQTLAALSTGILTGYLALILPRGFGSAASAGNTASTYSHPDRLMPRFRPLNSFQGGIHSRDLRGLADLEGLPCSFHCGSGLSTTAVKSSDDAAQEPHPRRPAAASPSPEPQFRRGGPGGEDSRSHPTQSMWLYLAGTILVILVALLLASAALPNLPWQPMNIPATDIPATDENINLANLAMYDYGRGLWLREHGSPWMFEYMPVWVQTPREEFFLPDSAPDTGAAAVEPLAVTVTPGRQTPLARTYRVASAQPWTLQLHQFYFPGWEAVIDGRVQPAAAAGPLGLAGVDVPAGEHDIVFRFGSTPPRRIGWAVTLAALAVWLVTMGLVSRRGHREHRERGEEQYRGSDEFSVSSVPSVAHRLSGPGALLVIVVIIYVALTAAARVARPADFTPAAVSANFANQVQLAGYHAPADTLQPDREAAVLLHWLALTDPATNYKVFVHLIDADGRLWAQHDGEPGFFFSPMTRWQAGEVVDDTHVLEWQGDPPPGRYQLRVGLYDPATGARLAVLGPDGQPAADQVLLAEFDIP